MRNWGSKLVGYDGEERMTAIRRALACIKFHDTQTRDHQEHKLAEDASRRAIEALPP